MSIGLCKRECSKCAMYSRCGGCSMCDISFCNCNANKSKCMVMCPNKFGTFNLVNKSVDNKILLENDKFDIESYIPIMPDRVQEEFNFNKVNNIIAVHGEFLLSSNGDKVSKNYSRGITGALGIKNIKPILEFYVKDRTLEGFWVTKLLQQI